MLGFVKMSALSAVLSFGVVTAYNHEPSMDGMSGDKLYQDRIPAGSDGELSTSSINVVPEHASVRTGGRKGDRLAVSSPNPCVTQTWPYVARGCLTRTDGRETPSRVRMITVETREGPNTSVLQRMPQTDIARR